MQVVFAMAGPTPARLSQVRFLHVSLKNGLSRRYAMSWAGVLLMWGGAVSGDSHERSDPPLERFLKGEGDGSISPNGPWPPPLPPTSYLFSDLSLTYRTSSLSLTLFTTRHGSPHPVTGVILLFVHRSRPPCSPPVSSPPLHASSSSNVHSRRSHPRAPPRTRVPASRLQTRSRSSQATTTLRSPRNRHCTTGRILTRRASRLAKSLIWSMEALGVGLGASPWVLSPFLRRLNSTRSRFRRSAARGLMSVGALLNS